MKNLSLIVAIFISLQVNCFSNVNQTFNKEKVEYISFKKYKLFIYYTRDSIMRKILSPPIFDYYQNNNSERINWRPEIDLNDSEIFELLISCSENKEVDYTLQLEGDYLVFNIKKLNYKSVNIFPEEVFSRIDMSLTKNKLSFKDEWFSELDTINMLEYLSQAQVESYNDWKDIIGPKETKKLIKNKRPPKRESIDYYLENSCKSM